MAQNLLTISAGGLVTEISTAYAPLASPTFTGTVTAGTTSVGALTASTVKVTSAGGYISSDNSTGITTTVTTASLVGKTITIKDGIITGFA